MSKIYLEILDKERQAVFKKLAHFKTDGYLAGGTALSLQIKHRKSVDFDIFTPQIIDTSLRLKVRKIFGLVEMYTDTSDQISFYTQSRVSVTFVWYYYHTLFPLVTTSSISLASVSDIAADKAHTLGRRAIWRDYVDIFLLLKNNLLTLEKIVGSAKQKFCGEFNETQFLEQLSYFGDVSIVPIDFVDKSYPPTEIKSFLEHQVETYLKKILP